MMIFLSPIVQDARIPFVWKIREMHSYNKRPKITQREKVRFVKVNELKLTQVELFSLFDFKSVAANVSELFCLAHLANDEHFLYHSNFSF